MGQLRRKDSLVSEKGCTSHSGTSFFFFFFFFFGGGGVKRRFETVFQSMSGRLPERGRMKKEVTDVRKRGQTTPSRTQCQRSWPLSHYCPNK